MKSKTCIYVSSLSQTEHGWAHGTHSVYSVIHGMSGTSIGFQPCLGVRWNDLHSTVTQVRTLKHKYTHQARLVTV